MNFPTNPPSTFDSEAKNAGSRSGRGRNTSFSVDQCGLDPVPCRLKMCLLENQGVMVSIQPLDHLSERHDTGVPASPILSVFRWNACTFRELLCSVHTRFVFIY